jgi:hypothetical protein
LRVSSLPALQWLVFAVIRFEKGEDCRVVGQR